MTFSYAVAPTAACVLGLDHRNAKFGLTRSQETPEWILRPDNLSR